MLVTGGSYGGYMTLASAFHFNDRHALHRGRRRHFELRHASSSTPTPYRRDLRRVEYGDERDPEDARVLREDCAASIMPAEITKPMFIVAGRNDPRVPAHEGEQMAAAIRKNGAPVWYLIADDEGHGFAKKKNRISSSPRR